LYLAVCLIAVKDWAKPPSDHVDPYQVDYSCITLEAGMVTKKASGDDSPLWQGVEKSFWTLPISGQQWRRLAVCFMEKCSSP
jgi:hypothetical protein